MLLRQSGARSYADYVAITPPPPFNLLERYLDELNVAFSSGCYQHCCSRSVGYGQDEY